MKFLVPIDGSPTSRRAAEFASNLLNSERDQIWLLCVVEAIPISELDSEDENTADVKNQLTREAEIILEDAKDIFEKSGFSIETRLGYGDAGETICEYAEEIEADTIILGRQGKGRVEEFLLGSVSSHVIHHSSIPVLTVPRTSM
ncbi:MAG: universal stress protein [bacterium]